MAIKVYKPTSNGRRNMTSSDFAEITKSKPEKTLLASKSKTAGRNSYGHITVRHRGGGHKQQYRIIDFKRTKDNVKAKVVAIEYDPNRSANIALLHYTDGTKAYILAPKGLTVGSWVESGADADIKVGNALPLKNIPTGTEVHNIELKPGKAKSHVVLVLQLKFWVLTASTLKFVCNPAKFVKSFQNAALLSVLSATNNTH